MAEARQSGCRSVRVRWRVSSDVGDRLVGGFAVVIVVAGSIWGLVDAGNGSTAAGSVRGTLRMVGGPVGVNEPVRGTIKITDATGQSRKVHTSPNGSYSSQVRPGMYRASGRSPVWNGGQRDCSVVAVPVREGRTSHHDVICDIF